jgi:hypothetical protein
VNAVGMIAPDVPCERAHALLDLSGANEGFHLLSE